MQLTPSQAKIARDSHRFRVLNCGRRFGKTTVAIEEIKGKALSSPEGSKIAYIAPTIQQARDIAWGMLKKEFLPITIKSKEAPSLELEVKNKDGKSVYIILRGWEAVETLRGQNFVFLVLDEVASMRNFWIGWDEVLSPTLIDKKGDALFISTPKGFNHFYDLFNKQDTDDTFRSFHFTTYDNPHIPREEIEREKKNKPENAFAQEYLADFRKQEGLVYKEFNRDIHLFDGEVNNVAEYIAGVDFGYNNPCAVIMIKKDFDNVYWITDEWYKTQQTEEQIAEYVSSQGFNAVYPDPENPSAIQVLQNKHVNVREVNKGKGSIESGISKVIELFKGNRLKIHRQCTNLISELETYRYPEKKLQSNEYEKPVKEHDHACDALRYAISSNSPYIESNEDFSLYSTTFN